MAQVISSFEWCSNPKMTAWVDYDYWRSGSDMKYKFYVYVHMVSSGGWYNDYIGAQIYVNGASTYTDRGWVKTATSGSQGGKSWHWTSGEITVSNKTSGSTPFTVEICNGAGSGWRWRVEGTASGSCAVSAAASTMGTNYAGSTLNGPTINVTRYDSGFTDNISLSYNGKTITRNGFTSSKLSFSEAERLLIFQAQGQNTTRSWSISGNTYSGGSHLGSYSGSVNISTEEIVTARSCDNFNVGDNSIVYTRNNCGGKYSIFAYLDPERTTSFTSREDLTSTGDDYWTMYFANADNANKIYAKNTTSKSGTIYYRIFTYINGSQVGYTDYSCSYTFLQSRCGPSLSTFKYAITDAGTKALMGSSGAYYDYSNNTDLSKFIKGKTTLGIQLAGTVQKSAKISKYWVEIPGQSNVDASSTTGTQTLTTQVLSANGTLYAVIQDSRKFEAKLQLSITLNDYFTPTFLSLSAIRNPMSSTDATADKIAKVSTEISIPSYMITYIKNHTSTYYIKFQYSTDGTNWTTDANNLLSVATAGTNKLTVSNYATGKIFNPNTQYYFRLVIREYYTSSTSGQIIIPISAPLISRRSKKVGINKIPSLATLDVGGSIYAESYIKSGSNVEVGTYIDFPTAFSASTNSCTLRFKRTDGYWDILKVANGEVFFYDTKNNKQYELLVFEEVS